MYHAHYMPHVTTVHVAWMIFYILLTSQQGASSDLGSQATVTAPGGGGAPNQPSET